MNDFDFPKRKRQGSDNTVLAVFLLLPFLLVALFIQLQPAFDTFRMSFTDFNIMRPNTEFVGFENYQYVFSDPLFLAAVRYTFAIIMNRIVVLIFVPGLVGLLVGIQGKIGRILNRFVLGILAACISPVALVMLWRSFLSPLWGREPSPLSRLPDTLTLASPDGAVNNTLLLDNLITLSIALVVSTIVWIAVLRGRETHRSHVVKVGFSVWIIGILFAVGSALQAFLIPFVLTRGGPGRSTVSLGYYGYQLGFNTFRMGVAAAHAMLLLLPIIFGVVIIWLLITIFRIRLIRSATNPNSRSNLLSILSLFLIALFFFPILGLLLWGHSYGNLSADTEMLDWGKLLSNLTMPILAIWLIQIPITYPAAAALGLMRPVNRTVSNILFLILLLIAFIPPETLMFEWFLQARDLSLLNTQIVLALPWMVSGISLLVFKLFFDGMYDEVQAAHERGQATDRILQKVVVSSLPLVLLIGLAASFVCIQSILWSFIAVASSERLTPTVNLVILASQYATDTGITAGAAVSFVDIFFLPFALAFGLLCGFGLERFALVGGTDTKDYFPSSDSENLVPSDDDLVNLMRVGSNDILDK